MGGFWGVEYEVEGWRRGGRKEEGPGVRATPAEGLTRGERKAEVLVLEGLRRKGRGVASPLEGRGLRGGGGRRTIDGACGGGGATAAKVEATGSAFVVVDSRVLEGGLEIGAGEEGCE